METSGLSAASPKSSRGRGRSASRKGGARSGQSRSPSRRGSSSRSRSGSPSKRGTSRSPTRFRAKDFDTKRDANRKSAIAKARGLKLQPSEWSKQELVSKLKKFAKFHQDKKTGVGELIIEGKRILEDDLTVVTETLRRYTEIQIVQLNNCSLSDDTFNPICVKLMGLRHLKKLMLTQNLLTGHAVDAVVAALSQAPRAPELISLKNNPLAFEDGERLFEGFPQIPNLNSIEVAKVLAEKSPQLVLEGLNLKLPEIGIVCSMIKVMPFIKELHLARNGMNSKALHRLMDNVMEMKNIEFVDFSYNPVTNEGTDFSGIERLITLAKSTSQLCDIKLEGIPGIPSRSLEKINLSLMVNRSIKGTFQGYHFNRFIGKLIVAKSTLPPLPEIEDWKPKLSIDEDFIRLNRIPQLSVEVNEDDEIILKKKLMISRVASTDY